MKPGAQIVGQGHASTPEVQKYFEEGLKRNADKPPEVKPRSMSLSTWAEKGGKAPAAKEPKAPKAEKSEVAKLQIKLKGALTRADKLGGRKGVEAKVEAHTTHAYKVENAKGATNAEKAEAHRGAAQAIRDQHTQHAAYTDEQKKYARGYEHQVLDRSKTDSKERSEAKAGYHDKKADEYARDDQGRFASK